MQGNPAVLVLVTNADRREAVRQRLAQFDVLPIPVRAARATEAVSQFHPLAGVIDEAHAATAPDESLQMTCAHRVRLVTLPEALHVEWLSPIAPQCAVAPRRSGIFSHREASRSAR